MRKIKNYLKLLVDDDPVFRWSVNFNSLSRIYIIPILIFIDKIK